MKACEKADITTFISPKDNSNKSKDKAYRKDQFQYDAEADTYTCPDFQILRSNVHTRRFGVNLRSLRS